MNNNDDILTLKNGKKIKLEWSFLVLEYLEEYPGGAKKLEKDIRARDNELKVNNYLCYAVIKANIDEPLTYTDIIKLVDLKVLRKILNFIEKNSKEFEDFKKKDQTYLMKKQHKNTKKKKK